MNARTVGDEDDPIVCNALSMKRCLSSSLYWYVEKSLQDMLEGYMLLAKDGLVKAKHETVYTEISQLVQQMFELPLEFDNCSRQLAVSTILGFIQRNIGSAFACKYLLAFLLRRKSEITGILKSDLITMMEDVFFREVKKDAYLKAPQDADSDQIHPKIESRGYAEILVELYHKEFISATSALVILDRLSKIEPSYYHADLLLFLLYKIGGSVEAKLSRGACGVRCSSSSGNQSEGRSTIEIIYRRLDFLLPYVISTESQIAYKQIIKDRKKKKSRAKKTRSREDVPVLPTNGLSMRGQQHQNQNQNNSNPNPADSAEGLTSL